MVSFIKTHSVYFKNKDMQLSDAKDFSLGFEPFD